MEKEAMQSANPLRKNVFLGNLINWNYNDALKSIGTLNVLLFLLVINSWLFSQYFNAGQADRFFVGFLYVLGFVNMVVALCMTIYSGLKVLSLDSYDRMSFMFAFLVAAIYCRVFTVLIISAMN